MILCDSGALVALLNAADPDHLTCKKALSRLPADRLLTTVPCLVEAMYFLGKAQGFRSQQLLWQMWVDGKLDIHCPDNLALHRIRELMEQYQNVPMDLADASLVAVAERMSLDVVFTLDSDFYVYRRGDGQALQVVP